MFEQDCYIESENVGVENFQLLLYKNLYLYIQ